MFSCCCTPKDDVGITVDQPEHSPEYDDAAEDVWWEEEGAAEDWGEIGDYGEWDGEWHEGEEEEAQAQEEGQLVQEDSPELGKVTPTTVKAEAAAAARAATAETAPSTPELAHPEVEKSEAKPLKFVVSLVRKCGSSPWGMAADLADAQTIFVSGVSKGDFPAGRFNKAASPEKRLQAGDYIVAVNDIKVSQSDPADSRVPAERMGHELQRSTNVRLTIQRPKNFSVKLTRNRGEPVGLDLNFNNKGSSLVIVKVLEGAVKRCAPQVISKDRILAVNGKRGLPEELLNALKMAGDQLELAMSHCPL